MRLRAGALRPKEAHVDAGLSRPRDFCYQELEKLRLVAWKGRWTPTPLPTKIGQETHTGPG